jgi:hypothetical protein
VVLALTDQGVTFQNCYDDDGEVRKTNASAVDRLVLFLNKPIPIKGQLKVRSIAAADGSAVAQDAARTIKLLITP